MFAFLRISIFMGCIITLLLPTQALATPVVTIGSFSPGLLDGSPPFNTSGNCPNDSDTQLDGEDCGTSNAVVRTQDIAMHTWSVTADNYSPGEADLTDVILEQTLTPSAGAIITFESVPVACTPVGGGGANTLSEIVKNTLDGSIRLTCNMGAFKEGEQKSVTVSVKISGNSNNGSSYSSEQRVYSNDNAGIPNAIAGTTEAVGPILISAAPLFDLVHSTSPTQNMYGGYIGKRDVGQGLESGFYTYTYLRMTAARKSGVEALQQPLSFRNTIRAFAGSAQGTPYAVEFHVTECRDNTAQWGEEVYGNMSYDPGYDNGSFLYHIADSGNCQFTRDNPADPTSTGFNIQIDGADLSGSHYPSKTFNETDLRAGPYYAMSHRVQIWVPFRSIDMVDNVMDNRGTIYLESVLSDFDPDSPSGVSNYTDGFEPGYNGEAMQDGSRSNNIITGNLTLISGGNFSKHNLQSVNNNATSHTPIIGDSWGHGGNAKREPGQYFASYITFQNTGTTSLNNPVSCDIFDNSTLRLADRGNTGGSPGTYAYVGAYTNNGFDSNRYQVEYAHIDLGTDDPLDADHDGKSNYNAATGRYEGDWDAARNAHCNDDTPANGWHLTPDTVPGGVDAVNAVRLRLTAQSRLAGYALEPGQDMRLIIPLQARSKFYSGPHDGEKLPPGTVLANFASVRSDEWKPDWSPRQYQPAPENGYVDGDRVTLIRLNIIIDSETLSPKAGPDETASTLAGSPIVWQLTPVVQSGAQQAAIAENVRIINVLPPEATYSNSCTLQQNGATPPDLLESDTDAEGNSKQGYTRLTWNIGNVATNELIPARIFCTDTDALAANGTVVTNYTEIQADNVLTEPETRSDQHVITLEQGGSIQISRQVDMTLDHLNDSQVHELVWSNFSNSFSINKPVVIDVFPFVSGTGDGANSLSPRTPASAFSGNYALVGAPLVTWLDGSLPDTQAGDPIATLGTWRYTSDAPSSIDHDPGNNDSVWCLENEFGQSDCPADFTKVTAIRFDANYDLATAGKPQQGMKAQYTVLAGNPTDPLSVTANRPGDSYTSRFTFDSSALSTEQFLRSNGVTVKVLEFSLGDMIFKDTNQNGRFDVSVDSPVPNGVPVELYDSTNRKVSETLTGSLGAGRYLFTKLAPGDYYVQIPASAFQDNGLLVGWQAPLAIGNTENSDLNETVDQHGYMLTNAASNGVRTGLLSLATQQVKAGETPQGAEPLGDNSGSIVDDTLDNFSNLTLDIGLTPILGSIEGRTWLDDNGDAVQDATEITGIEGLIVYLLNEQGEVLTSTLADKEGNYSFTDLMPGNYQVQINPRSDLLNPYMLTTAANALSISLIPGQHYTQADFGFTHRPVLPANQVQIPTLSQWSILLLSLLMLLQVMYLSHRKAVKRK